MNASWLVDKICSLTLCRHFRHDPWKQKKKNGRRRQHVNRRNNLFFYYNKIYIHFLSYFLWFSFSSMADDWKDFELATLRAELDILKDIIAQFSGLQLGLAATQPPAPGLAQAIAPKEKRKYKNYLIISK